MFMPRSKSSASGTVIMNGAVMSSFRPSTPLLLRTASTAARSRVGLITGPKPLVVASPTMSPRSSVFRIRSAAIRSILPSVTLAARSSMSSTITRPPRLAFAAAGATFEVSRAATVTSLLGAPPYVR